MSYDIEIKDRSPNYPDRKYNEFHVYYGVHNQIAHFKTRSYLLGWFAAVGVCLGHRATTWLHLTGRQS